MTDLTSKKIPVFPDQNDLPEAPTEFSEGNASYFVNRYNELVDFLGENLTHALLPNLNSVWFVSESGSDNNDGLTEQTAFQTIAKASEVAASYINLKGYGTRTIKLLPGSYNGAALTGFIPRGEYDMISIEGANSDRSEVEIFGLGTDFLRFSGPGIYQLKHMMINPSITIENTGSTDGNCIIVNNAHLKLGAVKFKAYDYSKFHIVGTNHAKIEIIEDYEIACNATVAHISLDTFSTLDVSGKTVTLSPNLQFGKFARLARNSYLSVRNTTFSSGDSGAALGQKFEVDGNSVIDTGVNNLALLPGNVAGILTRNSQYF